MQPKHRSKVWVRFANLLFSSLAVLSLLSACAGFLAPAATETPQPTSPPAATATAEPTATVTSTATPTPEPTQTASPTPDITGTAAAAETAVIDAFFSEVERDLNHYELTLDSGRLVYSDKGPYEIKMKSYMENVYKPFEAAPAVGDFLMQTEITWDSTSGLAGCGLIVRSEDDLEKGEQYQFFMMRLQNAPGWIMVYYKDGLAQYSITPGGDYQFTSRIKDGRETTNKIAILAKGNQITVFINGEGMRPMTNDKRTAGMLGMLGSQESGTSTCAFENTWIWSFDEP